MTETVDPTQIPDKPLTRLQLEDWILFGILVANKEATQTRSKLNRLYELLGARYPWTEWYFPAVRSAVEDNVLMDVLREVRTGQYARVERAFREVINLDLDNLTVASLESVHGIGPKTARMLILYAKPGMEVVPLDTHVLKYLRKLGYENVPKATPPAGPSYRRWEATFIEEAKKAGMSVRDFDTRVWKMYAKSQNPTRG